MSNMQLKRNDEDETKGGYISLPNTVVKPEMKWTPRPGKTYQVTLSIDQIFPVAGDVGESFAVMPPFTELIHVTSTIDDQYVATTFPTMDITVKAPSLAKVFIAYLQEKVKPKV